MVNKQHYDIVVVGAGLGGLITGAILAAKEGMKVIVLEKAPAIGGRIVSFGKQHGLDYSASQVKELLRECVFSTIIKSEPDFNQIIGKGILKDFILDGGWHAMSGGDRCRYALIARALGKRIHVSNSVGFAYFQNGRWMQLPEVAASWSLESTRERVRVAYERQLISIEEATEYDHVDIVSLMEMLTDSEEVRDYYCDMARYQMGLNSPKRISAGEWIRCNNATAAMGRHLIYGGGMGEVTSGFQTVANTFASIIQENGGEVRTRHPVTEVVIKNCKAQGVVAQGRRGAEEFAASYVVCNPPPYHLPGIIPEKYFVGDLMQRVKNMYAPVSVLGTLCLKEPLEQDYPTGQFVASVLPGTESLNIPGGPPAFGMEQTSMVDPSRCPQDRCLIQICIIVDPEAWRDKKLVRQLGDAMIAFLRKQYPRFDEILDWYYLQRVDIGYGIAPAPGLVGDRRFPVRHPVIRNLFFTGDCVQQWDVGSNGASHGAVLCASALSGRDYLKLLPPYWR